MSLFDVDKNSDDRGSPMPNTHDTVIAGAHKAHGTISSNYTTDATDLTLISGIKNGILTPVQSGQVALNYSFPSHAATSSGVDVGTVEITHNLRFQPITIVAYLDPLGTTYGTISSGSVLTASLGPAMSIDYWSILTDSSTLVISLARSYYVTSGTLNADAGTINLKYYLLRETAN